MKEFTINSNDFLSQDIQGYYHQDYLHYQEEGNPDFINDLKNQFGDTDDCILHDAKKDLKQVFKEDLDEIVKRNATKTLTVCVIPRAKSEDYYNENQKKFREGISEVIDEFNGLINGTKYIIRHTNTVTTHMDKSGYGGDGKRPYVGITKDTCTISEQVRGKDILLIDDIYTKTIDIDEDAIQALLDNGAKSVIFYAVGRTGKTTKLDVVTFKKIDICEFENNIRYCMNFNEEIDGVKYVDGEFVESKVSRIYFYAEELIEQCVKNIKNLDILYQKKKENGDIFGAAQLGVVLSGAEITLERTRLDFGYGTKIKRITITKKTRELIDKKVNEILDISNSSDSLTS